jgi:hypothetical protein
MAPLRSSSSRSGKDLFLHPFLLQVISPAFTPEAKILHFSLSRPFLPRTSCKSDSIFAELDFMLGIS